MKQLVFISLILIGLMNASWAQEHRRYVIIWSDEFNSGSLDGEIWSKIWRSTADWAIHMSSNDALYAFEDGNLVLKGMVNDFLPNDTAAFLTGGVWSRRKKAFGFGRLEVRAKFDVAQGFWPAIWMLPQSIQALQWPYGGEIDIMEHFRSNPFVNQTVHSNYTYYLRKRNRPSQVAYPSYNEGEYNTYGVERFEDSLVFFVNGKRTFCYPRYRQGENGQFPFSGYNYYLILDAQLGRDRSPYIDTTKLPVELRVDYVRYYELDTKTDIIPEPKEFQPLSKRKSKLRKIKVDTETVFDNPDEYQLTFKRGKATVAGNVEWAKSTLAQLADKKGKLPEVEIHDWTDCPYRGIAIRSQEQRPSVEALEELLDEMAFYKLNVLQWNSKSYSEDEAAVVREHAENRGIVLLEAVTNPLGVDYFEWTDRQTAPLSKRIFLQTETGKGAFLRVNGTCLSNIERKAMMTLSERYWRGGETDGAKLGNFEEKAAVHESRFLKKEL